MPLCGLPYFVEEMSIKDTDQYPYFDRRTEQPIPLFDDTLNEIFNRLDLLKENFLKLASLKLVFEALKVYVIESEFNEGILKSYDRIKNGLSLKGFKNFIMDNLKSKREPGKSD